MISLSAAEYSTAIVKACLGASIERGIANEIGPACMELALRGINPLSELVGMLDRAVSNPNHWEKSDAGWVTNTIETPANAVSMVDFSIIAGQVGAGAEIVRMEKILLGLSLHRMRCHELNMEVSVNGGEWTGIATDSSVLSDLFGQGAVSLRCGHDGEACVLPEITAINVLECDWKNLDRWTAKTLVAADEASRADAGAGNTDND